MVDTGNINASAASSGSASTQASVSAGSSKGKSSLIVAAAAIIIIAVIAAIFLSLSRPAIPPTTASTSLSTTVTVQQTNTTSSIAPTTITTQASNQTYVETIYYAGRNITILPGSSYSLSFDVPASMSSVNLTGAFSLQRGSVEAAVLNSTEYAAFEASPGSSIVSSKHYLGNTGGENISVILMPGNYTLAFFNPNASAGAQYSILITKSIALYRPNTAT